MHVAFCVADLKGNPWGVVAIFALLLGAACFLFALAAEVL